MKTPPNDLNYFDKLKLVEDLLIPHKKFVAALTRMQRVLERTRHGAEPRHTLLIGESGTGKSWLASHFKSLYPCPPGEICKPVLVVSTPSSPTLKGLAGAILEELGDPLSHRGTAFDKRVRAIGLMKKCQVEFMVFDEFHHFLDHAKHDSLLSVSDWLKRFIDDANVPVLLMGLPRCKDILQVNEQLRRRFSSRLELPAFSIDTSAAELEFRAVLKEIDQSLPTECRSGLAEVDMAKRLYFACNGLIGYLRTLITEAFEMMALNGRAQLDLQLFELAFTDCIWKDGEHALNPFSAKFQFRPLDRAGEPFCSSSKIDLNNRGRKK